MSTAPVLRPLGVGEILDAALAVYRRHAFALWKLVAVVVALPAALDGALAVAEHQVRDSNATGTSSSLLLLVLITQIVRVLATFFATGVAYRLVADAYLGRVVDPAASLRFGARRFRSVLWVSVLQGLAILVVGVIVAVIAVGFISVLGGVGIAIGILLFIALFVALVYAVISWSVAVPVLLGENLRGRAALVRSRALVRDRFWPCMGVLFLAVLLAGIVAGVIGFVVAAIAGSSNNDTVLFLDQGISSLIADTLVLPFQVAVTTVLYIDLRVRKEGFDVQLLAHSLQPGGAGET